MLALPLVVIGNAFEETVKEEERYNRERQKRIEIKMLQRFGEGTEENDQAMAQLEAIQKAADERKAKQKYSNEVVRCANPAPTLRSDLLTSEFSRPDSPALSTQLSYAVMNYDDDRQNHDRDHSSKAWLSVCCGCCVQALSTVRAMLGKLAKETGDSRFKEALKYAPQLPPLRDPYAHCCDTNARLRFRSSSGTSLRLFARR